MEKLKKFASHEITMQGKYSLTNSNINRKVDNRIGVYKLYNSRSGPVRYVGMSTELVNRLKGHTDDYNYFEFEYQPNESDAYRREARLYHHHGGKQKLDNEKHPPRPHQRVKCPVCGIHS